MRRLVILVVLVAVAAVVFTSVASAAQFGHPTPPVRPGGVGAGPLTRGAGGTPAAARSRVFRPLHSFLTTGLRRLVDRGRSSAGPPEELKGAGDGKESTTRGFRCGRRGDRRGDGDGRARRRAGVVDEEGRDQAGRGQLRQQLRVQSRVDGRPDRVPGPAGQVARPHLRRERLDERGLDARLDACRRDELPPAGGQGGLLDADADRRRAAGDAARSDDLLPPQHGGARARVPGRLQDDRRRLEGDHAARPAHHFLELRRRGGAARSSTPPACPGGRGQDLRLHVTFPSCWDGTSLDSDDHKSHMAYPTKRGCPADHPVAVPAISLIYRYPVSGDHDFALASGGVFGPRRLLQRLEPRRPAHAGERLPQRHAPLRPGLRLRARASGAGLPPGKPAPGRPRSSAGLASIDAIQGPHDCLTRAALSSSRTAAAFRARS